jgi:hypothetical protein
MIPFSGCLPWLPDYPRTLPRTGAPTPLQGTRPPGSPNVIYHELYQGLPITALRARSFWPGTASSAGFAAARRWAGQCREVEGCAPASSQSTPRRNPGWGFEASALPAEASPRMTPEGGTRPTRVRRLPSIVTTLRAHHCPACRIGSGVDRTVQPLSGVFPGATSSAFSCKQS